MMDLAKLLLCFFSFSVASSAFAACVVAIPDDCPLQQVCAKYNEKGDSKCFDVPPLAPRTFDLPFDSSTEVICTQSSRYSSATHIYRNMLYALDLATPYQKPASLIRASAEGKAFVFSGCKNPVGKPDNLATDNCGGGYGNHVRILHSDGYISVYAHLSEVYIKTGEQIKKHQKIGLEGATGYAGFRHLHWDIHKMEGHPSTYEKQLSNPAWGGHSVPFNFRIRINGVLKIVDSSQVACRFLDMKQPAWKGTYEAPGVSVP